MSNHYDAMLKIAFALDRSFRLRDLNVWSNCACSSANRECKEKFQISEDIPNVLFITLRIFKNHFCVNSLKSLPVFAEALMNFPQASKIQKIC